MGKEVSRQRRQTARGIASALARDAAFAQSLPAHPNGERPIMVVASQERARTIFARAERIGLPLTLAVRTRGELHTLNVRGVKGTDHVHADDVWKVAPSATMAMMLLALERMGGSLLLHVEEPASTQVDYEVVGV